MREMAALLGPLPAAERVREVQAVRGTLIGRLFDLAAGGEPLTFEDIVSASTPAGDTVTFEGRNSLPVFSQFQKRFARTADGAVFGHNHGVTSPVTGPGYFVVRIDQADHAGELVFDYTQPPPIEPVGWPRFVPNNRRLSRFVFMNMQDYVRRVAQGVLVGSAYKLGVRQDAFFSLVAV